MFYEVLLEGDVIYEILMRVTMTSIFINLSSVLYSKYKEISMLKIILHMILKKYRFFLVIQPLKR